MGSSHAWVAMKPQYHEILPLQSEERLRWGMNFCLFNLRNGCKGS